jgi:hypothetical protein
MLTVAAGLAVVLGSGCGSDRILTNTPPERYADSDPSISAQSGEGAFITDRSGKRWDVSHAEKYGMVPSGFQYGLGPYAIQPLIDAGMIFPGHQGYPGPMGTLMVLGVDLNGIARAYPTWTIMSHIEVANETFGEDPVAAAF